MRSYHLGGGWAVSLIWAMMILPLADALQNCLQNLTSRIAGVDNEQMTNRVMGMSAMLGFGVGAIKEQFKVPSKNDKTDKSSSNDGNGSGLKGFVSRAKSIVNPSRINLSAEKDYNGNVNPIRDNLNVVPQATNKKSLGNNEKNENSSNTKLSGGISKVKSVTKGIAKVGYGTTKAFLQAGASMAEGDFKMNRNKPNTYKSQIQTTEYANNISKIVNPLPKQEGGNKDESSKQS